MIINYVDIDNYDDDDVIVMMIVIVTKCILSKNT